MCVHGQVRMGAREGGSGDPRPWRVPGGATSWSRRAARRLI
ncbi:hypothetical protein SZ55_0013 [Pseudomonas sp. FeS53a]|nr:hypothetical protein SZ55_0013 [Pseudomonas sp. FeS53a]